MLPSLGLLILRIIECLNESVNRDPFLVSFLNLILMDLITENQLLISFMGSLVRGKRGIYKKKKNLTQNQLRCGLVRRRSENSIAARRAVLVGLVVFLADEGDRYLQLPVEEVRLGLVGSVLSVATVCLTPLVVTTYCS